MVTTLNAELLRPLSTRLREENHSFMKRYPGDRGARQPVHTVYGGAHLFAADSVQKLGAMAQRLLLQFAPDCITFARAVGLAGAAHLPVDPLEAAVLSAQLAQGADPLRHGNPPAWLAYTIYTRVLAKLQREPVEDFRIDFEDGYGCRPDAEEDGHADAAAHQVARAAQSGSLPPFIGIRIKPFTEELRERSLRTADLFLTRLCGELGGRLPEGFLLTLPKVTHPAQVRALGELCDLLEPRLGLAPGTLRCEIMFEATQALWNERGEVALPHLVAAAQGRLSGVHFGTYDYTASCEITAAYQQMDHPCCDFAKHVLQTCLAGTGIFISDGATNLIPIPPHRRLPGGRELTAQELGENQAVVHRGMALHARHVRRSLVHGFYQGWDLHPAQLPTRFAAVYAFFLENLQAASERLRHFVGQAAQASRVGAVFDDAATGQGLLNFFLRGLACGALTEEEALQSGLTLAELHTRSFVKILAGRRGS